MIFIYALFQLGKVLVSAESIPRTEDYGYFHEDAETRDKSSYQKWLASFIELDQEQNEKRIKFLCFRLTHEAWEERARRNFEHNKSYAIASKL
jgi:hypothetical protein